MLVSAQKDTFLIAMKIDYFSVYIYLLNVLRPFYLCKLVFNIYVFANLRYGIEALNNIQIT